MSESEEIDPYEEYRRAALDLAEADHGIDGSPEAGERYQLALKRERELAQGLSDHSEYDPGFDAKMESIDAAVQRRQAELKPRTLTTLEEDPGLSRLRRLRARRVDIEARIHEYETALDALDPNLKDRGVRLRRVATESRIRRLKRQLEALRPDLERLEADEERRHNRLSQERAHQAARWATLLGAGGLLVGILSAAASLIQACGAR